MDVQTRAKAMRFILKGMRHSGAASTYELTTRLMSLLDSKEEAQELLAEAERIGLIVPENLIPNPTPLERSWRLSKTFDGRRLEVPA